MLLKLVKLFKFPKNSGSEGVVNQDPFVETNLDVTGLEEERFSFHKFYIAVTLQCKMGEGEGRLSETSSIPK